jgi:hypothetical protein
MSNNNNFNNNSGNTGNTGKSSNSGGNSAVNRFKKTSTVTKIIIVVVLCLIIFVIVYYIIYAIRRNNQENTYKPVIVGTPIDAWITRTGVSVPDPPEGMDYSYSCWFYARDWNYKFGKWKNILWKGNQTDRHSPSLWFYPLKNSLKVVTSTTGTNSVESCDVHNIPLQKWVNITYVLNNRTVDIYINGKLERSCVLQGIPVNNSNDKLVMTYGNGFYGKVGKTQYFAYALSPQDIQGIYTAGPLGSSTFSFSSYNDGQITNESSSS